MKIYATIDKNGIDGFGFTDQDRVCRILRATLNEGRGMKFLELNITAKEKEFIISYFQKRNYKKIAKWLKEKYDKSKAN